MAAVRLYLLNGFELRIDDEPQTLQPAMQQAVALVALAPNGIRRDKVAFLLWPEKTEERARANLRSCLWRIGKLPAELIITSRSTLRLNPTLWIDVRHGLEELESGDEAALFGSLMPFHAMHADLLPDWYDDWLVVERERLRRFRVGLLERRSREALSAGDPSTAIQLALAAVSIDPYRAGGHRLVMEAHIAEGNVYEARREQHRYRSLVGPEASASLIDAWDHTAPVPVTVR